MDFVDEHLLKEIKFNDELPQHTELCLLLEKLLLTNENIQERNYSLFSRAELVLLIANMNIDIGLLKEQYKLICEKQYITYDESNFQNMTNPSYKSNRNPSTHLLQATKHLLFDSTYDTISPAAKMIQSIDKKDFHLICRKIKHCMLVANIEKKSLYYLDNNYGNKIIEKSFDGDNCPLVNLWRKLFHRKLYIEQYYPNETCSFYDIPDDLLFSESPYDDYLNEEYADLLPSITLDDYYSFEDKMNNIELYQTQWSSLTPDALLDYFTRFDQLLTASHDIYKLSLNKLIWLNNYGAEYLTHAEPLFLQILFLLLFTSREDRNAVKLNVAKSSLNIPMDSMNRYIQELEKIINLPSMPECVIDKALYHTAKLYDDVHRYFFSCTSSWFKFLVINIDNSHLRAAKLLYYESYIHRMHLKKTNPDTVLSEIAQQLRFTEENFNVLHTICNGTNYFNNQNL